MSDCWGWPYRLHSAGYGVTADNRYAHRLVYEVAKGPIPDGWQIDHQTHCYKGHAYTEESDYVRPDRPGHPVRNCVACRRAAGKRGAEVRAVSRALKRAEQGGPV